MQAFLLAAGNGTRLGPLTDNAPKCLLPIRGTPLLHIWLELCRRSGITRVLINVHAHAEAVRQFVRDHNKALDIEVVYEPELLGSAGTLRANRDWISPDAPFWVLYADVLTNFHLRNLLDNERMQNTAAILGVYRVPDPNRCGIAVTDEHGRITRFVEKPQTAIGTLAFAGILLGSKELLDVLPEQYPCDLGFDVLPALAGRMFAYPIRDYLLDIGTPANYSRAQTTWPGLL